ncbi:hypothetical protein PsAD5_02005 [Pseudovibrio sp. Ad5]|uniref:hypothetical protein n=1 Tax=Pseudovibrio sp. Ad5 TaxID=989436 RepID=UPI0007AE7717|nr:hypothetical protein [Pseudovibrio sp. Ad5]KZK97770.1 hypothetical protein PsAD5_02005 [Pseudovibrio sp. Ad5]
MPGNQNTDTGTDTNPIPAEDQMNQSEETWAQQIYKLWGEMLPTWADAFGEVYEAEREREREELAQATARMDEDDRRQAEQELRHDAASTLAFEDSERFFELKNEMTILESNPMEAIDMPDSPDMSLSKVIIDQIAAFKLQKEELFLEVQVFKGLEAEKLAFTTANELVGMLIDKAYIQSGVYNFAACEVTLSEMERKLKDMKNLLRDAQVHPATYVSNEDQVLIGQDVKKVKEIIFNLQDAGYTGLGTSLLIEMNQYQDAVSRPSDARWTELMSDAEACKKALPELRSSAKYIETLCESMTMAQPTTAASDTLEELRDYQSESSRDLSSTLRVIASLKAKAERRERWIKQEEWAEKNLDVRTQAYRKQLEKFVVFDADHQVVTKESKTEARARAVDTEGLDKDVMATMPKRPGGKDVKAVPRATINKLLESFEFLDEMRLSGVTGMEAIALEEFIKTEDILEGINSNPTGYDDLQTRTQKMLDKVATTKSGKKAIYYVEAKMNLEEDIRLLREQAPDMNINKALGRCNKLEGTRFHPLLRQLEESLAFREVFEMKLEPIEKIFKEIPGLLARLGKARPELAMRFKKIWQPKQEKVYHGELELELKQAKVTAHNAATVDDVKEAISQVNTVKIKADKYVEELRARVALLGEDVDGPVTTPERDEFFEKIEEDYKNGVQLEIDRKVAKGKFNETSGPMKDELEMLTAKSKSWKGAKALLTRFPRIDTTNYDPTRFKDLLEEVKLLEQESAVNSSYEENMGRLKELKGMYDAMRGELTGFREDIAKDVVKAAEKAITRMESAKAFAEGDFITGVASQQEAGEDYVNAGSLKRFTTCISKPIIPGELRTYAQVIGDSKKSLQERKKAREEALRLVRPLLARLDSDKAIKLYRRHPFGLDNDINVLRPVLVQLEVKLLTLAS